MEETGGSSGDRTGRAIVTVAVLVLIGLVGLLAFLAGRDDPGDVVQRSDERFPETSTTSVPTTEAPGTTEVPTSAGGGVTTTVAPGTAPTTTTVTAVGSAAAVVPNLAAFEQVPATPAEVQALIDQLIAGGRHDVAVEGPVLTLCATVTLDAPLAASGRWERDGEEVSLSTAVVRQPPGFGECLSDGGTALPDGSYQYVAVDGDGTESAAGGLVVGAGRIDQRFTNSGDVQLCALRIAPEQSSFFEVYLFEEQPIAPGGTVAIPVADVEQDVEAVGCDGEVVASFDFSPRADEAQSLVP